MSVVRLVFGKTNGRQESPSVTAKIGRSERYYSDFETYLVGLVGFAHMAEASNNGQSTRYGPADTVLIGCKQSGAQWFWLVEPTVNSFTRNHFSHDIFLERIPSVQPMSNSSLPLGAIGPLLHNFGQALATNYYERNSPAIKNKYGKNVLLWPVVWNFARVVRNAMSHAGKIHFDKPISNSVNWKNLSYSQSDNGRVILHTDLWPGDIFDLIKEMDAFLP